MAHYINPRSYAGFTSTDCRKEPFSEKDKSMVAKFDLAYHALIISLVVVTTFVFKRYLLHIFVFYPNNGSAVIQLIYFPLELY